MNEVGTYQKLRKSDKNAMDMLDVETLDYLLKKCAFESYINMYDTLCNMCKDGMIMNDDYMQCLIHPYKKWVLVQVTFFSKCVKECGRRYVNGKQ